MESVKVVFNSSRPAQLHAFAFAQGGEIHVAPGQERHLPHEAWHVVQQMQGRVKPTRFLAGNTPVNNDRGLEHEADRMGARASRGAATPGNLAQTRADRAGHPAGAVAQLATTNLRFEKVVTGNSEITATLHNRSGVHLVAW